MSSLPTLRCSCGRGTLIVFMQDIVSRCYQIGGYRTNRTQRDRPMTEWLTSTEAAAYLKVAPRTLVQWAREGKIQGHRLSGCKRITWRFLRAELDAMLSAP